MKQANVLLNISFKPIAYLVHLNANSLVQFAKTFDTVHRRLTVVMCLINMMRLLEYDLFYTVSVGNVVFHESHVQPV